MRKLLLITTALVGLSVATARPAQAAPITAAVGGWLTGVFGATVAKAITQLGMSLLLSAASAALAGKPKADAQRAELARPTALPAYRFVYGTCWAPGTPVAWQVVGDHLYICYLLNSRPSALTSHTVLFDKRPASDITGDPFDFAGPGAAVTTAPFDGHTRYWIGRGAQTSCPDLIVSETDGYFAATDAWQGRTVLWAKLKAGAQEKRSERWPATPPEVQVEGDWSLVHDPRDDSYSASSNQALIVLDALRNNPVRPYTEAYLRLDTFGWAADVADELIATKDDDPIPRYRADGVLVWSDGSELEDQVEPLLAAGASRFVRIGGRLGIVPACHRASVHTITDITDGQPLQLTRWKPGDDVYTECAARYVAPDRAYEVADAPVWVAPGAVAEDGGLPKRLDLQLDFVTDHRQAQRLAKIAALRSRMQREVSTELFPDAFVLVAGSICTLALPAPYTAWNGTYEVESAHPAAGINEDDSITLRIPVRLRETSAAIYAWDAESEEQDVIPGELHPDMANIAPPASLALSTGGDAALIPAVGEPLPRVQLAWPATTGASVVRYEWEYAIEVESGELITWGAWVTGGSVAASTASTVRAWIDPVYIGAKYRARVRSVGLYGASDWVESSSIVATGPTRTVGMPEILLAVGGAARIDLTIRQANDAQASAVELWVGAVSDSALSDLLQTIPAGPNVTVSTAETGLGGAETRFYWARTRDALGNASALTASATATTTP